MVSRKGKYAIRAILFLAREYGNGPVTVERITKSEGIPRKFLEAIMLDLKVAGLLHSLRGQRGGYTLQKHPSKITIGSVISAVEGPIAVVGCVSATAYAPCADCPNEATCEIRMVMREVQSAISGIVDLKTLDDILRESKLLAEEDTRFDFQI